VALHVGLPREYINTKWLGFDSGIPIRSNCLLGNENAQNAVSAENHGGERSSADELEMVHNGSTLQHGLRS
jgi:hypothetical protein